MFNSNIVWMLSMREYHDDDLEEAFIEIVYLISQQHMQPI
jgi:hypothetical protein